MTDSELDAIRQCILYGVAGWFEAARLLALVDRLRGERQDLLAAVRAVLGFGVADERFAALQALVKED
jgi:hypothetical protein